MFSILRSHFCSKIGFSLRDHIHLMSIKSKFMQANARLLDNFQTLEQEKQNIQ